MFSTFDFETKKAEIEKINEELKRKSSELDIELEKKKLELMQAKIERQQAELTLQQEQFKLEMLNQYHSFLEQLNEKEKEYNDRLMYENYILSFIHYHFYQM